MIQSCKVGTLTIANGAAVSGVLSNHNLRNAVRLGFYTAGAFTNSVTVAAGFGATAPVDLYVAGIKAQIFGTGFTMIEGGGFDTIKLVSSANEGSARTIDVYAFISTSP